MPPRRGQTVITWGLIGVWFLLMCFGAVSIANPSWLQELSRPGVRVECNDSKNMGDDALRQGKIGLAITQYRHALSIMPAEVGVMVNLGIAWIQAGYDGKGARILKDALGKTNSNISRGLIYYHLGGLHEKQGKRDEAIECYQKAVDCGTELGKRYCKLGSLYLAAEEWEQAHNAFKRALADQLDVTRSYREMLHRSADTFEDDTILMPIIEEHLSRPLSEENLARYDLEIIRQVQRSDRAVAVTHNYLGWACVRMEKFALATEHFEKSLQIWPGNRNAAQNLEVLRRMEVDMHGREMEQ